MNTLINTYIAEVGKNLPEKQRSDIEAEIRSLLEDTLEDRSQKEGRQPDEEMTLVVLKEFGSPDKVAASYLPERYLIGPRLYPLFMLVLRILVLILAAVAVFGFAVTISHIPLTAESLVKELVKSMVGFVSGAVQALGNIVLIFAILQWVWPNLKVKEEKWDPQSLKEIEGPDQVKPLSLIWEILITLAAMLFFNLYAEKTGIYFMGDDGLWKSVQVLAPVFFSYIPLFNLAWILEISLDIVLLRQGRWQVGTRWFSVAISLVSIAIAIAVLSGPSIIQINPAAMVAATGSAVTAQILQDGIRMSVTVVLGLVIALNVAKIVQTVMKMSWGKFTPVNLEK